MSEQTTSFQFDGWGIFEAMGHIKRAGQIRTSDIGGAAVFIVRSENADGDLFEEIFAASALFRLTACTEEAARMVGRSCNPSPVSLLGVPYRVQMAMARIEREEREKRAALEAGGPEHDDDSEARAEDARGRAEFDAEFHDEPF